MPETQDREADSSDIASDESAQMQEGAGPGRNSSTHTEAASQTNSDNQSGALQPEQPEPSRKHWWRIRPELLLPRLIRVKLGSAARYVSIVILLVLIAGASGGAWLASSHFGIGKAKPVSRFAAETVPFAVVSTTPSRDQQDVRDGSKIVVTFTRPVDPTKLDGDFFVSPEVDGTFTQGANDKEAVFMPAVPFGNGMIIQIMIHGEYQSKDGAALGADYSFGFTMATPNNAVLFQRNNYQDIVGSIAAGDTANYTLQVGDNISDKGKVTIYKSTMDSLLSSLLYVDNATPDGYKYTSFKNDPINTSALDPIQTIDGLKDQQQFSVDQGEGVYVIVATDNGAQVGSTWLVVSSFGVVARQDDQRTVLSAEQYSKNQPVAITATFYNLHNNVQQVARADINGAGEVVNPTGQATDVIVAQTAEGKQAFIPISIDLSMADLRVQKDLSKSHVIYGLTDRPTYQVGDTVNYAGYVRLDNDGQYTTPVVGTQLKLYATAGYADHLADFTATVGKDGTISGSLPVNSSFAPADGSSANVQIYYAAADQDGAPFDQPIASFVVTKSKPSNDVLNVSFGKTSYIASDNVSATVTGKTKSGSPLTGATVTVTIYAKQYYEGDASQNQASSSYTGDKLKGSPYKVTLDANGKANIPVHVSSLPAGTSQVVTIQTSTKDSSGNTAAGGASAVIHEGDGVVSFGSGKSVITPGGNLVARVYAQTLSGTALAGASIHYSLSASTYNTGTASTKSADIASGEVTADGNGYAVITRQIEASYTSATTFDLEAWTGDTHNNKITAHNYYYIQSNATAYSDVELTHFDVSGSPLEVPAGQTMNLTVTVPYDVHALVSLERGRIHSYKAVDFKQGDNPYQIEVTPDLAPSFSLVFSYFHDGSPNVEGVTYDVPPASLHMALALSTNASSYTANSTATITLHATDADGKPLATNVVLGVVDANVFNLNKEVTPDMFTFLYGPREITTNSSSSLTGIGSGGGKCGGGGYDQPNLLNPLGTTLLWKPMLATDASGTLTASLKLPKGTWRVYAYAMSAGSLVANNYVTVTAK